MKRPEVSVILAVWNEDNHLANCLVSLSQQRGLTYEVIVVDDGSYKKFSIFADDFSRASRSDHRDNFQFSNKKIFRFFRIKHSGTAKARNFGAKKARGRVLVFVDGDMKFSPDFLTRLTRPICQGKAKGTFSTQEFVANWDNVWARCWNWENGLPDRRRIAAQRDDMVKDFRAILKSEFDKVDGFDDIGYTDTWTLSEKLGYRPQPTVAKYWHYNPETLHEVFRQAAWIGGRKRRFDLFGKLLTLVRASIPISLVSGTIMAARRGKREPIVFKLVYDLGIFAGIIGSL
jgi:glycosyltransferase involved in cell wall biosynthesis